MGAAEGPLSCTRMSLYAALTYRDITAAIAWLETAFGLERDFVDEGDDGQVHHAAVKHGGGMVLIECERPEDLHGSHTGKGWIYMVVVDADRHYERAKAAGAEVLGVPHGESGFRGYSARDLEGNLWSFGNEQPT